MRRARHALGLVAWIATGVVASPAAARDDGAIEINGVRAAAGALNGSAIFDPAGFPVIITQPGLYRLTSNLDGGSTASELIRVSASEVTLDLNGFTLAGGQAGIASLSGFANSVTVRNGSIRGMTGNGTDLNGRGTRVEAVRAIGNGGAGIAVHGEGALVLDCLAVGNGGAGIVVVRGTIQGSVAAANRTAGFDVFTTPSNLVLRDVAAIGNGQAPAAASGATVANASVADSLFAGNSGIGLHSLGGAASGLARSVISGNAGLPIFGNVVATGPNRCDGSAICP